MIDGNASPDVFNVEEQQAYGNVEVTIDLTTDDGWIGCVVADDSTASNDPGEGFNFDANVDRHGIPQSTLDELPTEFSIRSAEPKDLSSSLAERSLGANNLTVMTPSVEGGRLGCIISISRLSYKRKDIGLAKHLENCNEELQKFAIQLHRVQHADCNCEPELFGFTLNGISSNNSADMSTEESDQLLPVHAVLQRHLRVSSRQMVNIVVSTADGFFTNAHGFLNFVEP